MEDSSWLTFNLFGVCIITQKEKKSYLKAWRNNSISKDWCTSIKMQVQIFSPYLKSHKWAVYIYIWAPWRLGSPELGDEFVWLSYQAPGLVRKIYLKKKKIWHWYLASYIYILLYLHTHLNKFTQNTWMQRYKHRNTQGKYTYIVKLDSLFLCRVMHSGIIMRYYLALVVLCWHPSQPTIIKNKETIMQNFVSNL